MKSLNDAVLRVGDIILATSTELTSKTVRRATGSDISHAMIYVETCSVIDSTDEGVQARNTQRLFWPDHCAIYALRLKHSLTDEQTQRIITYVRSKVGTRYSKAEAVRSVLGGGRSPSRKQFCSRLVAQAYAAAGISLVESPDYCTPEDLRRSDKLMEIEAAAQTVTDHHVELMKGDKDTSVLMRDATNRLLTGARKRSDLIEDLNDIDQYLIHNPQDDSYFAHLLAESGYLTVWRAECEKNLWQYDLKGLNGAPIAEDSKRGYCEAVLDESDMGLQRYEVNRAGYTILFEQFHLESFRVLKELYERLLDLQRQRRAAATQWLSQYSLLPPRSPQPSSGLVPHSAEWFAALEKWNPQQAAHTREIVTLAGNAEVCSICGDSPAKDYRLVGHALPAAAVGTLRLCNDCWNIRRGMYVESFGLS